MGYMFLSKLSSSLYCFSL